jgi:hypothetical protein
VTEQLSRSGQRSCLVRIIDNRRKGAIEIQTYDRQVCPCCQSGSVVSQHRLTCGRPASGGSGGLNADRGHFVLRTACYVVGPPRGELVDRGIYRTRFPMIMKVIPQPLMPGP